MATPTKIGRYDVIGEIGRGGMATIFSARDPLSGREVAIKILPTEFGSNMELRARFEREMRAIASLEHPGIVPVYDFGEHEDRPYFVMRLMQGGSLTDRLRQGPLSLEETAIIVDRVASALDEAHDHGIIHRDLKPGNILFDRHGDPFLTDFGIAKIAEGTATLTHGAIVGTPAYMSPEQGSGDPNIDRSSDIYSLGVIVFEMLTGRVPYKAEAPMAQVMMHITEPVPDILAINPDLPPEVQMIIATAMAKRKFVRFARASSRVAGACELEDDILTLIIAPNGEVFGVVAMTTATPVVGVFGALLGQESLVALLDLDVVDVLRPKICLAIVINEQPIDEREFLAQ